MKKQVNRLAADLSKFPDLVVIYLGMRVNTLTGIKTLLGLRPQISQAVDNQPDGLLLHEDLIFSLFPAHVGMRQYWRDFESMETWTRSLPHKQWWENFLRDSGGTGFWHEVYSMRGSMEGIYNDMSLPVGFMHFAPVQPPRGPMFSSRGRLQLDGEAQVDSPVAEDELYKPNE